MFHNRTLNKKINRLHERCLRMIYNDLTSSFTDLLEIYNSVSVQIYRSWLENLCPKPVNDCFKLNNMTVHSTRNRSTFYSWPVRTALHGTKSFSHVGPKIWELLLGDMKNLSSLIKPWKPHACPCQLCRSYIYQVGFV